MGGHKAMWWQSLYIESFAIGTDLLDIYHKIDMKSQKRPKKRTHQV